MRMERLMRSINDAMSRWGPRLEPKPAPVTVSGLWSWSGLLGNMDAIYNIASTYYVGILTIGLLIYVVLNELNKLNELENKLVQNQIDALNENFANYCNIIL